MQKSQILVIEKGTRVLFGHWFPSIYSSVPYIGKVINVTMRMDDWGCPTIPVYDIEFPFGVYESVNYDNILAIPENRRG